MERGIRHRAAEGKGALWLCVLLGVFGYAARGAAQALVVLCEYLEVALWMVADGADFGCLWSDDDVSAVGALPDGIAVLGEYFAIADVLQ